MSDPPPVSRRDLLRSLVAAAGAAGLSACDPGRALRSLPLAGSYADGRLTARPHAPSLEAPAAGRHELELDGRRVLVHVPSRYRPDRTVPLALLLHGASGNAEGGFRMWAPFAEQVGLVLLAPESNEGGIWDVMVLDFGADVEMIDRLLAWAFDRFAVDADRLAIGGFSNGATYSLSLGLTNGDLFSHVVAMSPGGMSPEAYRGRPPVFISHGVDDRALPIDRASRRIVPELEDRGYDVSYVEFDGGHKLRPDIAAKALRWFLGPAARSVEPPG